MKSFGKCRGCEQRKLINLMRLCKRCNKEAHKYISKEERAKIMAEHETLSASKAAQAEKKAQEDAAKKEAEVTEEGEEGEEGEEPKEETAKKSK